jgi:hypothetical protein
MTITGSKLGSYFEPNEANIEALGDTPAMAEALGIVAGQCANNSKGIAPVRSGAYRDSIVEEHGVENGKAFGRVVAGDYKAGWIEFGTVRAAAKAVLRKGAELAGLKVGVEIKQSSGLASQVTSE